MIARTYEQACKLTPESYVATDSQEVFEHVQEFGKVIMTSENHRSGTDRIKEACENLGLNADYIINIQGDEPFINPEQVRELIDLLDGNVEIASQATFFRDDEDPNNQNMVKVVLNHQNEAMYFSRSLIPFNRGPVHFRYTNYLKHIGIYAYRQDILNKITSLPVSSLEEAESLEQLRWLENGYKIRMGITNFESKGIDTQEDVERAMNEFFGKKFDTD